MSSIIADRRPVDAATDGPKVVDSVPPSAPEPVPQLDRPRRAVKAQQFKREKYDVHGWVVLDKPIGMTSNYAVAVIKRLFAAKRAGHAGTLAPLASECLPIALGDATNTVPFVRQESKIDLEPSSFDEQG